MAIHDKPAATAERLIRKHGRDVTLYRMSGTPADAAKPWLGAGTTFADQVTVKAVFEDYTAQEMEDDPEILRGDKRMLVPAKSAAGKDLEFFHKVDDAGDFYSIVRVKVLQPGTTRILYTIQVRG